MGKMSVLIPYIAAIIYGLTFIATIVVMFIERRSPGAVFAWIIIMWTVPGIGLLLYLIFSQPFTRASMKDMSSHDYAQEDNDFKKQVHDINTGSFSFANAQSAARKDLIHFNQSYAGAYLTQKNSVQLFSDGEENFRSMFEEIKRAKSYVNIEYFIVKPDIVGLELITILTKKAKEGVKVRLLMDAMGSRSMYRKHYAGLEAAGGEVALFLPGRFSKLGLNFNYRDHRKIVVIDGRICYLGGLNVAKEYIGITKKFKGWRDTNIRIEGEAVYDADTRFLQDWAFAAKQQVRQNVDDYDSSDVKGSAGIQIVSCGPERPESEIKLCYLKLINSAKRRVYIQSPYVVTDDTIFDAIKTAALSGVDVRIMIPDRPDHPFVYWVTYRNVGELLDYGVKVYIYRKGFLHAKTVTVDSEVSSVGSANFDIRSFELSFETNAIVYDRNFAIEMENAFERDIQHSTRLTKEIYESRSRWIRFKEGVSRMLTGIL